MFVDTQEGGNDRHAISGLTAGEQYDIAIYGGRIAEHISSSAAVTHAGGTTNSGIFGFPSGIATLPGTVGIEYALFSGLLPFDVGGGDIGFIIASAPTEDTIFSAITGFQIRSSSVPEPSTYAMAAIGLLGLGLYGWRRKRA